MKSIAIPLSMSSVFLLPCQGGYLQVDAEYMGAFQTRRSQSSFDIWRNDEK